MANMAERVWEVVGSTVLDLLEQHQGYEFVIIGHSLGAGTASLLNILLHQNNREMLNGRKVRCFAFASPPVFTPLEQASDAVEACTNFIHEHDCVSFLSVDSVRHLFNCVRAIEEQEMKWMDRMRLVTKYRTPHRDLVDVVDRAHGNRLEPKPGAPVLAIPASSNIWLKEQKDTHPAKYDSKVCDSIKLAHLGIFIRKCWKITFRPDTNKLLTILNDSN
jgi:pimeloyl-ACP methyl ester carboxylesterase